jgi:hypothetical protein
VIVLRISELRECPHRNSSGVDHHPDTLNVLQQRQLLQLSGNGFGTQEAKLTAERKVYIRALVMGSLGAGAEQRGAIDFRMQAQHGAHQLQFGGLQGGAGSSHRLLLEQRVQLFQVAPSFSTLAAKASLITWRGITTSNTTPLASM